MALVHQLGEGDLKPRALRKDDPGLDVVGLVVARVAQSFERVHEDRRGSLGGQRLILEAETPAGHENTRGLVEERLGIGEVVCGDAARDDVETGVGERECGGVGDLIVRGKTLGLKVIARLDEHLRGEIGDGDPGTRTREGERHVPCTGRDIQRAFAGTRRHFSDEKIEVVPAAVRRAVAIARRTRTKALDAPGCDAVDRTRALPHVRPPVVGPVRMIREPPPSVIVMPTERSTMSPILIVMLDGLGDRPWPALGGLTPLQAAQTPNLDAFAAVSATGILATLGPGRAPGTELAHFVLFGYPLEAYPGRAVFEAAGQGLELAPDQVALHAIFATVRPEADGTLTIVDRYPGVPAEQIAPLADRVAHFSDGGLTIRLHHTVGEQAIVTIDGGASCDITDTDPHNNGWSAGSIRPLDDATDPAAAARAADALTAYLRFAYSALAPEGAAPDAERPFLLLKWTGRRRPLASFPAHTGMRGTIVSSAGVFEGIARELGMEHRRMTSLPDLAEDTRMRLAGAAAAFADGADFVLMHSKQPDEAGHEKNPVLKRDVIAGIDAGLAGLAERTGLPPDTIVVVTGDHGTPAGTTLIHSGDPVPIAILADSVQPDDVCAFDERACAHGRLGHLRGEDLMPLLLNARGTVRYMGGRLSPHTGLHWPRDYEPFRPGGS